MTPGRLNHNVQPIGQGAGVQLRDPYSANVRKSPGQTIRIAADYGRRATWGRL